MNDYEKLAKLGEGSFGKVYKVVHKQTKKEYAVKQFKHYNENGHIANTLRELSIVQDIDHPNIVKLQHIFRSKSKLYAFYDFFPFVLDSCKLDKKDIMFQLLSGVSYLHEKKIIHRDLNPGNILVGDRLVIADFGGSRYQDGNYTREVVTLAFRAPEICLGEVYTEKVDIWSLGCIFLGLFKGKDVFRPVSEIGLLREIYDLVGVEESYASSKEIKMGVCPSRLPEMFRKWSIDDENLQNLMTSLLCLDPNKRISAKYALNHPFFMDHNSCSENLPVIHTMKTSYPVENYPFDIRTRFILTGWLQDVNNHCKFHHNTLFMAVKICDSFVTGKNIKSTKYFQLYGITCLYIASKMREVFTPHIDDFAEITASSVTAEQIREVEIAVLEHFNWHLPIPIAEEYTVKQYCQEISITNPSDG